MSLTTIAHAVLRCDRADCYSEVASTQGPAAVMATARALGWHVEEDGRATCPGCPRG